MASKMIAIKEELYLKLSKLKKTNQSFSDIIEQLLKKYEKNPLSHFGIGKNIDPQDLDDFENILLENRSINQKMYKNKWNKE
ncbi:MAG: antitoxin VapB family protein [Promethearchaeota archaeon]